MVESSYPPPAFLRTHSQFVQHRQHGVAAHTALGLVTAVTNRGKRRLDGVRRANMHPVFGREVVEG